MKVIAATFSLLLVILLVYGCFIEYTLLTKTNNILLPVLLGITILAGVYSLTTAMRELFSNKKEE